jgi:hypothetical protein
MSKLVTSSPTSGCTTVYPSAASLDATVFQTTNSSSYFVRPSPLTRDGRRFPRGRRCEDVADHRPVGETVSYDAAERGIVACSATNHHGHLVWRRRLRPHDSAVDTDDVVGVGVEEAVEHVLGEVRCIVEKLCHDLSSVNACGCHR